MAIHLSPWASKEAVTLRKTWQKRICQENPHLRGRWRAQGAPGEDSREVKLLYLTFWPLPLAAIPQLNNEHLYQPETCVSQSQGSSLVIATVKFFQGIVSLKSRPSGGNERIPFLTAPHCAGHVWRMDGPRTPDQTVVWRAAVRQPRAGRAEENPLKRLGGPTSNNGAKPQAAGNKQQAGQAGYSNKGVQEGVVFWAPGWPQASEAESQSRAISAQLQLWLKTVFVWTVGYGLERAETVTPVFLAPSVLTDNNPH